jgi:hypothetical protein
LSKQANPSKQIPSPAELIGQAEGTIAALEQKREQLTSGSLVTPARASV